MRGSTPRLTERTYDQLRDTTETHREELVIRLCGEVGLRTGEITRFQPVDLDDERERTGQFLTVRETDGGRRRAYVPAGVAHDIHQYVQSNDIGPEESVIDVTPRRVQMLVDEVTDRAIRRTDRTVFEDVTPSTLRQWYGYRLLVKDGLDVRVVTAVGGWQGVDELIRQMEPPTREEIANAFDPRGSDTGSDRLERLVSTLDAVDAGLVSATTREEIDQVACSLLTDSYRAAWVADRSPVDDRITVRAHAGESPDRFDGPSSTSIVRRTLQTGRTLVAPDEPGPAGTQEGHGLLAAAPLAHGETSYGALVVRADSEDAFDDPERTALTALGRRIGFAVTATERKLLLLGGTVLELRFGYTDSRAPLVALSEELGCRLALSGLVPGEEGSLVCFLDVHGTTTEAALEAATETAAIAGARLVRRNKDGGVLEVVLADRSPLLSVTERGGTVTDLRVDDGVASFTCEFSPDANIRVVHSDLRDRFPSVDLRRKQERQTTRETPDFQGTIEKELTAKQRAVLEGAYHAGYFEWPRESTAEELAESMGVSPPTLHNHLRKAQGTLLDTAFENGR